MFDEEVDSIRFFDAESQRSLDKVEEVTINPATELLIDRQEMLKVAERLEDALSDTLKKSKNLLIVKILLR